MRKYISCLNLALLYALYCALAPSGNFYAKYQEIQLITPSLLSILFMNFKINLLF